MCKNVSQIYKGKTNIQMENYAKVVICFAKNKFSNKDINNVQSLNNTNYKTIFKWDIISHQ